MLEFRRLGDSLKNTVAYLMAQARGKLPLAQTKVWHVLGLGSLAESKTARRTGWHVAPLPLVHKVVRWGQIRF